MNKDYLTLILSYNLDDLVDEDTLLEHYNGDIVEYLKFFLDEEGKHEFIDWFEIVNLEEEK